MNSDHLQATMAQFTTEDKRSYVKEERTREEKKSGVERERERVFKGLENDKEIE